MSAILPAVSIPSAAAISPAPATTAGSLVYFGTYTRGNASEGVYAARFDPRTGVLSRPGLAARLSNPTFLAQHPSLPVLYAIGDDGAKPARGMVSAFRISPADGALAPLNAIVIPEEKSAAAHIAVDAGGRAVFTAHYGGGFVAAVTLGPDGAPVRFAGAVRHGETGAHPQQSSPHPHCIHPLPGDGPVLSADLAADKVFAHRFDYGLGAFASGRPPAVAAAFAPGSGTRHVAFSADWRFAYVVNELAATVAACKLDARRGALREIQTLSTVPENFAGRRWAAEVAVHPSGRFLYVSNRAGHESIAVFAIDADTGRLAFAGHATGLAHPRHFAIDPSGGWLLCANHDANNIVVFRIDPATGGLAPAGDPVPVPAAVCVRFARAR
ncbi:MAG: lactonase family protein [Opitutaceae bacterium]|nr:lactonase family protein [Opitutaceae bacterium]